MEQFKIMSLGNGVEGGYIRADKFKSSLLCISFYLPHSEKTAGYVLVSEIISNVSARYPTITQMKQQLDELYGASLHTRAEKFGDMIRLEFLISFIDDKFALGGDRIGEQAAELLISALFEPSFENGLFKVNDIDRDKRVLKDSICGEFNNKRIYAAGKTAALMCPDEPYGLPKYGTVEQIDMLTAPQLRDAWQTMLTRAFVRVNYIGPEFPENIFSIISKRFSEIERTAQKVLINKKHTVSPVVKSECEKLDVKQSKLFLGFGCDCGNDLTSHYIMLLTIIIFSGGTFSKCFKYVREKLSLCYYCAPTFVPQKDILFIDCGIDIGCADKAKQAILTQLENMQAGNITEDEFESAVLMEKSSLKEVFDSPDTLAAWLKSNTFRDEIFNDIEEHVKIIDSITLEQIKAASKTIYLDSVYLLEGTGEGEIA